MVKLTYSDSCKKQRVLSYISVNVHRKVWTNLFILGWFLESPHELVVDWDSLIDSIASCSEKLFSCQKVAYVRVESQPTSAGKVWLLTESK